MLENQQNFQNKKGLGFAKSKKNKRQNKKSYRLNSKKYFNFINCFYYNQRGHHIKYCYYRNGIYVLRPNEKLHWLLKVSTPKSYALLFNNIVGPKTTWVSSSKE